ncbi:MAG TPA: efflux transporter outer membrane subunit [Acetobacteraceae bacterium]|nr:efflux transporter outer membrane subunit [Acetobacteraceae bacterium]
MSKLIRRAPWPAAALTLLLSGCASVPDLGPRPQMREAASFASGQTLGSDIKASVAVQPTVWPDGRWWLAYNDSQLTSLIDEGLSNAPDLAAAVARLHMAEGYAQQAGAALLPQVDLVGQVNEAKQSYNNGVPKANVPHGWNDTGKVGASFSFDLDLWGKNRAALKAATSDRDAAQVDLAQARLLLATNIVSAYADLARLYAEHDVQMQAVAQRSDIQKLVANRVAIGLDTRAELKQADSAVSAEQATLTAIEESIGLTHNLIAALLGKGPDRGRSITRPANTSTGRGVPTDVTTNLLGRRPDIVSARERVLAAASRIKVARADFYPSVSLNALIGFQSLGLSNLLTKGSFSGQAGPAVSLPIFHGGAISGRYRVARATYDEAVANYDRTVADAFHEVADAVTSRAALDTRLGQSRQSLTDAQEAYDIARKRYEGGLSTYLDVLTAENGVLTARRNVADLQARAFTLDVALVRALGGGAISQQTQSALADATSKETPRG